MTPESSGLFSVRHARSVMLLAAVMLIPLIYGAVYVDARKNNQASVWLPKNYDATRDYAWFREHFGSDEIILISWEGCTLSDPRLETFAQHVEGREANAESQQLGDLIDQVTTGSRVAAQLEAEPIELTRRQVTQRLYGLLVGPDREMTCAVVTLSDLSSEKRSRAVELIRQIAHNYCDVKPDDLHLSGDIVINVAIDEAGAQAVDRWILPSALIALGAAWLCLRSLKLALIVFILSQYCSIGLESFIYFTGGSTNLLLALVPVLIYVLAVSACVHVTNYYRDAIPESGIQNAPTVAIRHGWRPCFISAITTALGLASLGVSHVAPVKSFGFYGFCGVLLAFSLIMVLLPASLTLFPERRLRGNALQRNRNLGHLAALVVRARYPIIAVSLVLIGVFVAGTLRIKTSVSPRRFLAADSRWNQDIDWFRETIGPMAPFEILLGIDQDAPLSFADRMRLVRDVQRSLHGFEQVGGSCSAATFAPPLGRAGRQGAVNHAYRVVQDRQLEDYRDDFLRERYLAEDGTREWWRVSLRIQRFQELDVEQFTAAAKERIAPIVADQRVEPNQIEIKYTGAIPVLFAAQRELLASLAVSFGTAMIMITVVMVITLRSILAGLIIMLPNIFPALSVFGTMGWSEVIVDVGSMMTASIALGIAVDDTLHYLAWYQRATAAGASRRAANMEAFQRCAPAMLHTTLIAGLGLFVFFFSDFQPVSRFGLLMFSLLGAALVGDLILLPAMLASPVGRLFRRGGAATAEPSADSADAVRTPTPAQSERPGTVPTQATP